MSLAETKLDLIAWLSKLKDSQALDQIAQIKNQYLKEDIQDINHIYQRIVLLKAT